MTISFFFSITLNFHFNAHAFRHNKLNNFYLLYSSSEPTMEKASVHNIEP